MGTKKDKVYYLSDGDIADLDAGCSVRVGKHRLVQKEDSLLDWLDYCVDYIARDDIDPREHVFLLGQKQQRELWDMLAVRNLPPQYCGIDCVFILTYDYAAFGVKR